MDYVLLVLELLGGVGLFLYGMSLMGSSLEKLAGGSLEKILEKLTTGKSKRTGQIKGWGLGTGVTAIIQSSAATTLMLIGFVNAGIMKLGQAIPVVFGANVGSTATAIILSLGDVGDNLLILKLVKPKYLACVLLVVGAFIILFSKKKKLKEHKKRISEEKMKELALACERKSISFYEALAKPGLSIIGEFKKASPSMGKIKMTMELTDRIDEYNESVDAISCLTEEDHFLGNTEYFKEIRKISPLPMIRKDFIIDPYQIYEAKVIGADCILLIAAILSDDQMKEYDKLAAKLGMDVLVEIHDEEEMERVLKIHPKIIGVNNRNLKDFTISLENTKRLRPMVPEGTVFVSESGVTTKEHIAFLKECKVDALLIGGAFMLSEHPKELAADWKALYDKN